MPEIVKGWAEVVRVEVAMALKRVLEKVRHRFRQRMPPARPYTFTDGNLSTGNIITSSGKLAGILDWKASGSFPVWWKHVSVGLAHNNDDQE